MEYKKYMKVQRDGYKQYIGRDKVYVMPKIDGTNAKLFYEDGVGIVCGSRNRALYEGEQDNQGFRQSMLIDGYKPVLKFFEKVENRKYSIFGEWLRKHTIEYKKEYYNQLYVFDLYDNEMERYIDYEESLEILKPYGFNIVPILGTFQKEKDITEEMIRGYMKLADNYLEPVDGYAEGIVIKDYATENQVWTKVIQESFYVKADRKRPKAKVAVEGIETMISQDFFTGHFIDKELKRAIEKYANINNPQASIGKILFEVKQVFFEEEILNILKKYKKTDMVINFKSLYKMMDDKMRPLLLSLLNNK